MFVTLGTILTLATGADPSVVVAVLSTLIGLAALGHVIVSRLADRAQSERDRLADERHKAVCSMLGTTNTRVTQTKEAVDAFRSEAAREFAALHQRDAELALDLERRVAPIEGRLNMGQARNNGGDA